MDDAYMQAQVLAVAVGSPNQEIAFVMASGYTAISCLAAGMIVTIPNIAPHMKWLNFLSMIKYPYQAMLMLFFRGNEKPKGPFGSPVDSYIDLLELNQPPTFWTNVAAAVAFYLIFISSGYLFLKYLYKEKR